jgi:hypothetical protein
LKNYQQAGAPQALPRPVDRSPWSSCVERRISMRPKRWLAAACLTGLAVLFLPAAGRVQEKKELVYRNVPSDFLEKVLGDMNITYRKSAGKKEGTYFYDFERNNFKVRIGNHGGKDLWIDAAFPRAPLEQINQWNVRAKFSRAVLAREGERETALVEAQLDCVPGVTAALIRQFINRFDKEVRDFDQFLAR